jgi:hypothetical protein
MRWTCRTTLVWALVLLASSGAATIWTRSTSIVPIRPGELLPLKNAVYGTRDWTVSVRNVEIRPMRAPGPGLASVTWAFSIVNTDTEPHYVDIGINYLDVQRRSRVAFSHRFRIEAGETDTERHGFEARCDATQWQGTAYARIVVDFLSTPEG